MFDFTEIQNNPFYERKSKSKRGNLISDFISSKNIKENYCTQQVVELIFKTKIQSIFIFFFLTVKIAVFGVTKVHENNITALSA